MLCFAQNKKEAIMTMQHFLKERFDLYIALMRADKPIGSFLLLWPMYWALWIAGGGMPHPKIVVIMTGGLFLTRSAGCIINDVWDRNFDAHVERTQFRPLAQERASVFEALTLASILLLLAFGLVLLLNPFTVYLSFGAVALMVIYPYLKRVTHFPQLGLSLAFSWSVLMAFSAQTDHLPGMAYILFLIAVIWPVIYDTMYAMVDREDDLHLPIKSTAIWLGDHDRLAIGILQAIWYVLLWLLDALLGFGLWYRSALVIVLCLLMYQQYLIKDRAAQKCFKAFLNNHYVGMVIFAGIFLSYLQMAQPVYAG
jgi:4-hydroxybenzoate polyprenyltransferase